MDTRANLRLPAIDRECSRELQQRHANLTKVAQDIGGEWREVIEAEAAYLGQDPATFDPSAGRTIAVAQLGIMQRALAVRLELNDLDGAIKAEVRALHAEAIKALEAAKTQVEDALLGIGFPKAPPLSVEYHPGVIAAANRVHDLGQRANEHDFGIGNSAAIALLRKDLESAKKRLLAV